MLIWALPKQWIHPPICAYSATLWHILFAENERTAILTSGMDILTMTTNVQKLYGGIRMENMVNIGEIWWTLVIDYIHRRTATMQ